MQFEDITKYLENPAIQKIGILLLSFAAIWISAGIFKSILGKRLKDSGTRYTGRKIIDYVKYLIVIFIIIGLYGSKLSGLTVFLGVAGAGVAFALQEIITSIAGFLAITFSNFYNVGDRIMLGGIKGDVIDVSILRTSMMQIGDWVDADLYNGKIVRVANSFIFKEPVYNYSGEFPFLWDEVRIPIRTSSDYLRAKKEFYNILYEIQGDYAKESMIYWKKMTAKYMIEDARVDPMVTLAFDENWITFTLRYVVDFKKRRTTKNLIYLRVLDTINNQMVQSRLPPVQWKSHLYKLFLLLV